MTTKNHVYSLIETSSNIPTLPGVLLKLLDACEAEDTSLLDIADIISRDPALSFRVLQLINSSFYGLQHAFTGIEQAVVYLGADTIKNLVVTSSVHLVFSVKSLSGMRHFESSSFWYHSLMTGTIARRLAHESGSGNAEEAYLAGMLHDIGKLLFFSTFSEKHTTNASEQITHTTEPDSELQSDGVNHCEAGSWLVRQWKLNSLVADAIQFHHDPVEQVREAFPLVRIVYIANLLAKGECEAGPVGEVGGTLFDHHHINFEEVVRSAAEEVGTIAESLGITVPQTLVEGAVSQIGEGGGVLVRATDSGDEEQEPESETETPAGGRQELCTALTGRIKNVSLLSVFQEELIQAEGLDGIFSAFESAMAIQFDIDKVLFFLPDQDGVLLRGQTSLANFLRPISRGLVFPLRQNSSLIVKVFEDKKPAGCLSCGMEGSSIADQQLLSVFRCSRAYPIPLVVEKAAVGVIVLGLPEARSSLSDLECQLLRIIALQVGMRLQLEKHKRERLDALEKERLAEVTMAARKFADEIHNPLGIIGNYLATLKLKLADKYDIQDELGGMQEEIDRISLMANQMEMFSQAPFSQFSQLDVNEVIRDITELARSAFFGRPGLSVTFIPGTDIPPINSSQDALKQILINLLKNAAEAMAGGGRVLVRTRKHAQQGQDDNGAVEIIIADSGPGLPQTVKDNLHTPIVRTEQNGHFSLGLSIVRKVVNDIGGRLSCLSSQNEGTTFTLLLPEIISVNSEKKVRM
jgi:putative nucleotidyltransferase with HDIG domain